MAEKDDHTTTHLAVKLLSAYAELPVRASASSAGYDLFSPMDLTIPAESKAPIPTDIAIAVPPGTYGRIAARSGLAWKHHLTVGAGVIDADYRGNVTVLLFNHSKVDYHVKKGDRIGQLILERIITPAVLRVDELDSTVRGGGGFGSTGK